MPREGALSLDGPLWRSLARRGSQGPEWFVRLAAPVAGLAVCGISADRRRHVLDALRRVRGRRGALRDTLDVARVFATYASCLAETLGADPAGDHAPHAVIRGEQHLHEALSDRRGVILVTAHTAGWETVGTLLSRDKSLRVMLAVSAERSRGARAIQDDARTAHGLLVTHVGDDPLSALPLARHLREGGAVALQIDRAPPGLRSRTVNLFGAPSRVPEGPLRLSMLTGAPIVPVFAARTGHRRYVIDVRAPLRLGRSVETAELDAAAQTLADDMQGFLRSHPTQWFHFRE
ncbi:MAG: lysophospholipid acyltransferase family protein [Polyangiaceae bacterium]